MKKLVSMKSPPPASMASIIVVGEAIFADEVVPADEAIPVDDLTKLILWY